MATAVYKVLGQLSPTTTAEASFGTPASGKAWVISTLTITNLTATTSLATVSICQAGAVTSNANTLMSSILIPADSLNTFTIGITLAATDVIRVTSGTANALSFQLFGSEVTY